MSQSLIAFPRISCGTVTILEPYSSDWRPNRDTEEKQPPAALACGAQLGDPFLAICGIEPGDDFSGFSEVLGAVGHGMKTQ